MRYLSLCSGIEAASVAWLPLGWTPVAYAEHDPECITDTGFAAALLQERFPETRNLGDITKIRASDVRALGQIDLVVGGTPCQDLSVAGAREGIQGARNVICEDVADPVSTREGRTYTHEGSENFRMRNAVLEVAAPITHGGHPGSNAPGRRAEDDVNLVACFDETQITHPENRSTALPDAAAMAASARPPTIAFSLRGREEGNVPEVEADDVAPSIRTGGGGSGNPMVVAPTIFKPSHCTREKDGAPADVAPPLSHDADKGDQDPVLFDGMAVRRLTPTECERLFGFPDGWTAIQYRGKPAKDTPRYAALGKSMAVNVLRWIGQRLQEVSP